MNEHFEKIFGHLKVNSIYCCFFILPEMFDDLCHIRMIDARFLLKYHLGQMFDCTRKIYLSICCTIHELRLSDNQLKRTLYKSKFAY